MSEVIVKCQICGHELEGEEKEFAVDEGHHPGVLGPVCKVCYERECKEDPDLPWTDPISGEVDYEAMSEDLGVDDGTDYEEDEY